MALLDVSDVLDDPDFWSELYLIQSIVTVQECGLAEALSSSIRFRGVAQPNKGQGLIQTGDGDRIEADLIVWTRYPLDTGTRETAADIIVYGGQPYTVTNASPWLFGAGYVQAACMLASINPTAIGQQGNGGFLG